MSNRLALIGFGEAGSTFAVAAGWHEQVSAFDIDPQRKAAMAEAKVINSADARSALTGTSLVLSLVTANQALAAAQEYACFLRPGTIWCDMNSVAPDTKRSAARLIEVAGANYVDVAVLAPVHPARMDVPLLISGGPVEEARIALLAKGFRNVKIVGKDVGRASSIKMIRSVMVKGIEALTDEMMAAAEAAGVAGEVLGSLDSSERNEPWAQRAAYNLERMTTHGTRRAAEMEESAKTLAALGVDPVMTTGTVRRQREAAGRSKAARNAAWA